MEDTRDGNDSDSRADTSMTRVAVSSAGGAGIPDASGKALQRRTAQLVKNFGEKQRAAVVQLINEATDAILQSLHQNEGEVEKWSIQRIKKALSNSRSEATSSAGEARELAKVKVKTSQQGTLAFCGRRIPAQGGVPPYKSWSYLMRNEQANEIGGRVFYTDATGETIPASDSEDEERQAEGELEGAGRERSEWVMRRLAQEAGAGPDVVSVLAKRFGASKGAVASRLEALRDNRLPPTSTVSASDLPVPHTDFKHELDKAVSSFCRRCRIYNCVTHSGPHVRPLRKRPYYADPKQGPCSDRCWRSDPRCRPEAAAAVQPEAGPAGSAQPAARGGSIADINAAAAAAGIEQERATGSSIPDRAAADTTPAAQAGGAAQRSLAGSARQQLAAAPARRRSQHSSGTPVDLCSDSDSDGAVQSPKAAAGAARNSENASDDSWSAYEVSMLSYGVEIFSGDACKIARVIASKTCVEVHTRMRELLPNLPQALPGSSPAGHKRKPGAPQRRKNASQVVQKRHKHDSGKPWPAYSPCSCAGACDAACPCLRSKNFCEKFCGCSPAKCGIRFQGCDCKSGCRSKTCPCFAAGHECDTDLCKGCTKSLLGAAVAPGAAQCCNMRLRFRQHKRVAMGLSDVAGWGSFLLEQAYKGDLLGEYTGELVNQQEADRRGKAYDRDDNSYLFNLNEDWVIDARRRGNKLRFANHSADPNCMAKILMVDGDHRVGIYARKDIRPGTELTYDYCYSIEQAPSWARARRQSKKAAEPVAAQAQKLATG